MAEKRVDEALEKLNQGIQKANQMVQLQTIEIAQEYFGESIEALKRQLKERRSSLEALPKQVPWGQEEPFQILFRELMENYTVAEKALDEAARNAANLDLEQLRRYGQLEATAAARREARKRGVDLREVEGTGAKGRIVVGDVRKVAKQAEHNTSQKDADEQEPEASHGAKRQAEESSIRLEEMESVDSEELITGRRIPNSPNGKAGKATEAEEEGAGPAWQTSDGEEAEEPNVTNAARCKAEEMGIDLHEVEGTGFGNLITMSDVLRKAR